MALHDIGVVGMAVMGSNLALNMADHGYDVSVYNYTPDLTEQFLKSLFACMRATEMPFQRIDELYLALAVLQIAESRSRSVFGCAEIHVFAIPTLNVLIQMLKIPCMQRPSIFFHLLRIGIIIHSAI